MNTSHHILGFWFHITWTGNEGIDQHGNKWNNPDSPYLCDESKMDSILDAANKISTAMEVREAKD